MLTLLAMLAVLIPAAQAEEASPGIQAFEAKNYAEALRLMKPEAEAGDPVAQYYMGQIFQKGLSVEPDLKAAAEWYRKSALGYGEAMERGYRSAEEARRIYAQDCEYKVYTLTQENRDLRETLNRIRREIGPR